jgi:hypothetical protein
VIAFLLLKFFFPIILSALKMYIDDFSNLATKSYVDSVVGSGGNFLLKSSVFKDGDSEGSVQIGDGATASADNGIAIGSGATAGDGEIAIGSGQNVITLGNLKITVSGTSITFHAGNATYTMQL